MQCKIRLRVSKSDTSMFWHQPCIIWHLYQKVLFWTESGEIRRFNFALSVFGWLAAPKNTEGFWLKAKRQCSNKVSLQLAMAAKTCDEPWAVQMFSHTTCPADLTFDHLYFGACTKFALIGGGGSSTFYSHLPAPELKGFKKNTIVNFTFIWSNQLPQYLLTALQYRDLCTWFQWHLHRCALLSRVIFDTWAEILFIYSSILNSPLHADVNVNYICECRNSIIRPFIKWSRRKTN